MPKFDRSIRVSKSSMGANCVRLTATQSASLRNAEEWSPTGRGTVNVLRAREHKLGSKHFAIDVCATGAPGHTNFHLSRVGRRGGIRAENKAKGGMLVCQAAGEQSKCLRSKYSSLIVYPGGAGWARKRGIEVFGRYKRRRR